DAGTSDGLLGLVAQHILDWAQEPSLGLLVEDAATPGVEHVGGIGRLEQRCQLGLECLVLKEGQLDHDVRVLRHEIGSNGIHQLHFRRDRRDVKVPYYGLCLCRDHGGQPEYCGERNTLHNISSCCLQPKTTGSPPWLLRLLGMLVTTRGHLDSLC